MNRFITAGAGLALIATPLVATTASASDTATSARQAPAFSVSAAISKTTAIGKEDTVKIRGKVSPNAAGDKVVLQQRLATKNSWAVSGTTKVKPNGKFVLKDEPTVSGTRFYRVLKPAADGMKKGVSKELELVVYGWEKLGYRSRGPATGTVVGNVTIATESYAASIVTETAGTPASIEYTLGKKCLSLRSTYALTDSTATGGSGTVALKLDGRVAFASGLALGQVLSDVVTNVTDVFRISFELVPTAAPDAQVAVGSPEVLCTR